MTFNIFISTLFLAFLLSKSFGQVTYYDYTADDIRSIIRDKAAYKKRNENLKQEIKTLSSENNRLKRNTQSEAERKALIESYKRTARLNSTLKANISQLENDITLIQEELFNLRSQSGKNAKKIRQYEKEIDNLKVEVSNLKSENEKLLQTVDYIVLENKKLELENYKKDLELDKLRLMICQYNSGLFLHGKKKGLVVDLKNQQKIKGKAIGRNKISIEVGYYILANEILQNDLDSVSVDFYLYRPDVSGSDPIYKFYIKPDNPKIDAEGIQLDNLVEKGVLFYQNKEWKVERLSNGWYDYTIRINRLGGNKKTITMSGSFEII